jgi:hypothetical protein
MDELKNLYRLGFPEDSEDDVEYFFKEKIRGAEIFSYSEGGKILSAAYIFKRKLRFSENASFGESSKAFGNSVAPPLRPSHGGECGAASAAIGKSDESQRFSRGGEYGDASAAIGKSEESPRLSRGGECGNEKEKIGFGEKDGKGLKFYKSFKDIEIPFLVAAATLPEFRGKKIFHNVMRDIFSRYGGEPFIALYPFKHEYYRKNFGFENFNYLPDNENFNFLSVENFDCTSENDGLPFGKFGRFSFEGKDYFLCETSKKDGEGRLPEILSEIYSSYAEGFDLYILRDGEYFEKKIAEWRAGGGKIGLIFSEKLDGERNSLCCEKSGNEKSEIINSEKTDNIEKTSVENIRGKKPVGYVFFRRDGGVEENCFINPSVGEKFYGKNPVLKPAMMIKILNEKKAAEFFSPRVFSDLKTFSLEKY